MEYLPFKALILANERPDLYQDILESCFGVAFMGTPHRGADLAYWTTLLSTIVNIVIPGAAKSELLKDLEINSRTLGSISTQFVQRAAKLHIVTFFERHILRPLTTLVCIYVPQYLVSKTAKLFILTSRWWTESLLF